MKQENGKWSYPDVAPFSGKYMDGGVKFSHDGHKLYLGSIRGGVYVSTTSGMDLWEINRIGGTWAEPEKLADLNSNDNEMNPCETPDGMLYWIVEKKRNDPEPRIFRSKVVDGRWMEKEIIDLFPGRSIPMPIRIYAFGPDGSYILLTMPTLENDIDIFVSFKKHDGTWEDPIGLGPNINSSSMDKCPILSPDSKYLFFVSSRPYQNQDPSKKWDSPLFDGHESIFSADTYWVDAKIIEALRPAGL